MENPEISAALNWLHWLTVLRNIGAGLVLLGVAFEFGGDWFSEPFQKKVDEARERQLAQLRQEATRLSTEADKARAEIADANARALEAKLALERFKAPIQLSDEQQQRISGKLVSFAGTKFDVGIGPKGDIRPLVAARYIVASLGLARWIQVPWTGEGETYTEPPMQAVGLTMVSNIIVDVHPSSWEHLGAAAKALADALIAEGIDAIADSKGATLPADVIHLRIGPKL